MADNVTANSGSGGATFATDDIGGIHYPICKLTFGALDSQTLVSTSNGLPVAQQGTWTIDTELTTADLDTGAGTDTRAVLGVVLAASGGAVNMSGNSGNKDNGTVRVVIATDQPALANAQPVSGTVTANPAAATTGGATPGMLVSAATTNATNVKGSAGTLYALAATSINAAARYIKFYDKATAPTVGTDTPILVLAIPGNAAGAGIAFPIPACGIAFTLGIGFALTTGIATADTGAVAASEIAVSYAYK